MSSLLGAAPPPCIIQFQATPARVEAGQPVLLTWTLAGGTPTRLTLEDDLSGASPMDLLGKGSRLLPGAVRRQTFTLRAGNGSGASSASLTVVARGLSLLAGGGGPAAGVDGLAGAVSFRAPSALALDPAGNLLVADTGNAVIRRVTPDGVVTTLAGQPGQEGDQDGAGPAARFRDPEGLAVDAATGTIFVADTCSNTIRTLAPDGRVTTLAGAPGQPGSLDGVGAGARFNEPRGLALDDGGALYVADSGNGLIRRVSTLDGSVTTLAGMAGTLGYQDGPGPQAQFAYPWALAVDREQAVYVADTFNNAIRKIAGGTVTTLAGHPDLAVNRDGDLTTAAFSLPMGILLKPDGGLLVCEAGDGGLRALDATGVHTLPTGPGRPLKDPTGLTLDAAGALYVADTGHDALREIAVGTGPEASGHGQGLGAPKVVVEPVTGAVLAGDASGRILRLPPRGKPLALDIHPGFGREVALKGLGGFAVDSDGTIFTVNVETASLLAITPDGVAAPVADLARAGAHRPVDLAVDSGGHLFVTDAVGATVLRVSREGTASVFAGTPLKPGSLDGPGDTAGFTLPMGLAVDAGDNLIVADQGAHTIRRVSPTGFVTTLAGKAGEPGSRDGGPAEARFNAPEGVAVDDAGNVFVADTGNGTVRRIGTDGTVTTVAGVPGRAGTALGPLPGGLSRPRSLAVTPDGDLVVLCGEGVVQITAP